MFDGSETDVLFLHLSDSDLKDDRTNLIVIRAAALGDLSQDSFHNKGKSAFSKP